MLNGKKKLIYIIVSAFVFISFIIKCILILKYKNTLTLSSDDLNYIKSTVVLCEKGILTYSDINEPSVFIMPGYPFFLACIFKVFGYGLAGIQAVRLIQALLSCMTVVLIFLIARDLFDYRVAITAGLFVAFYPPNITTSGLVLTETLFTTLLYLLIYLSIKFSYNPDIFKFMALGTVWTLTLLIRPTIAFYPVFLFIYLILYHKVTFRNIIPYVIAMSITFITIMSPWWIRNYIEIGEFIPLAASSGNPMLQGTYVDYKQTSENTVYYKLGKNALETNRNEVETAKKRIISEFKKDFWGYLRWFTIGKTYYFWSGVFYWKEYLNISAKYVLLFHKFLLIGFVGISILLFRNFTKYILPVSIVIYFNLIHCVYMAFDRYAFPLMPILSMFCAYVIIEIYVLLKTAMGYGQ